MSWSISRLQDFDARERSLLKDVEVVSVITFLDDNVSLGFLNRNDCIENGLLLLWIQRTEDEVTTHSCLDGIDLFLGFLGNFWNILNFLVVGSENLGGN